MSDERLGPILRRVSEGDPTASQDFVSLVYEELRRVAQKYMRQERPGHTLQATALVHEAFIKISDANPEETQDRAHFFRMAARAMRWALVDHARKRGAVRRGGEENIDALGTITVRIEDETGDLIALNEQLENLKEHDEQLAAIVELRFFGGLENDEIAEVLGVSSRTVQRGWNLARAWLHRGLGGDAD